jgi:hypothetical protein
MSEHTPTTENVRNVYAYIGQGFAPSKRKSKEQAEAEFDRWLAHVKTEAWGEGGDLDHEPTPYADRFYREPNQ